MRIFLNHIGFSIIAFLLFTISAPSLSSATAPPPNLNLLTSIPVSRQLPMMEFSRSGDNLAVGSNADSYSSTPLYLGVVDYSSLSAGNAANCCSWSFDDAYDSDRLEAITGISFSPNDRFLYSLFSNGEIRLKDLQQPSTESEFNTLIEFPFPTQANRPVTLESQLSQDGRFLVVSADFYEPGSWGQKIPNIGGIAIVDTLLQKVIATIQTDDSVNQIKLSGDSKKIFVLLDNGALQAYDRKSLNLIWINQSNEVKFSKIFQKANADLLAIGHISNGNDTSLFSISEADGISRTLANQLATSPQDTQMSSDGTKLYSLDSCMTGLVSIYDSQTGALNRQVYADPYSAPSSYNCRLKVSRDEKYLFTSAGETISIFELN